MTNLDRESKQPRSCLTLGYLVDASFHEGMSSEMDALNFLSDDALEDDSRVPAPRVFRDRTDPFDCYSDCEFKVRFRFSKLTTRDLIFMVHDEIQPSTMRSHAVTSSQKVS